MNTIPEHIGIILIDHGSRQAAANEMLNDVVRLFKETSQQPIVEAAHMELAEPTLLDAFNQCIKQGATEIVIHPYFLAPGRHSTGDIPRMAEEIAANFPDIPYRVTQPLGIDPRMSEVIVKRIHESFEF